MPINTVNLTGRLGNDPDVRFFESGTVCAVFSLAVSRGKDQPPDWFEIKSWGKSAEMIQNYFKKGKPIQVSGELNFESWNDRITGERRRKPVIKLDSFNFVPNDRDVNQSNDRDVNQGGASEF